MSNSSPVMTLRADCVTILQSLASSDCVNAVIPVEQEAASTLILDYKVRSTAHLVNGLVVHFIERAPFTSKDRAPG